MEFGVVLECVSADRRVVVPVVIFLVLDCSRGCEKYQVIKFGIDIVASQACLAAVSLLCLSHNLREFGIRRFLFVYRSRGHMMWFRDEYVQKILSSVRLLMIWMLPCLVLKDGKRNTTTFELLSILIGLVGSWTYTWIDGSSQQFSLLNSHLLHLCWARVKTIVLSKGNDVDSPLPALKNSPGLLCQITRSYVTSIGPTLNWHLHCNLRDKVKFCNVECDWIPSTLLIMTWYSLKVCVYILHGDSTPTWQRIIT